MSQISEVPVREEEAIKVGRWKVRLYNNDRTPYQDVVQILMVATECGLQEANIETWEAHNFGFSDVHFAARVECERVARVIGQIGVKAEVCAEWDD